MTKQEPQTISLKPVKTNAAKFENGASRSHHAPQYELIPKAAIDRLVKRLELGAEIHGPNNWKGGGPDFIVQCKRHLAEHLFNFLAGDKSDDHLGAILCNAAFLAHFEAESNRPMHDGVGKAAESSGNGASRGQDWCHGG